jgi:Ser/Thr protein kinase RdoA (MazF antagonist)
MKNNFESKFIQNLIHLNYGLRVKAEQIEGELDDNFKLNCDGKSYFFKVYPANSDLEFVTFQTNLLNHLKTFDKTPKNILTNKKKPFDSFIDNKNSIRYFRMNEWIGVLMGNDGLDKNVIKIKPPLIFSIENSKKLLMLLKKVLEENFMKSI